MNNIGASVLELDRVRVFEYSINKKFKYYFDLEPIYSKESLAKSILVSDKIDNHILLANKEKKTNNPSHSDDVSIIE